MDLTQIEELLNYQHITIFSVICLFLYIIYFLMKTGIKNSRMPNDQKRKFFSNLRASLTILIFSSALILWSNEVYQFTISVAALTAAFAIAGKEVFLCFGGSFYKAFTRSFSVGDRIEVTGIRGDVVDVGLMSTQLLEVGPKNYTHQLTGRMITIPNSVFLSNHIFNETDNVTEGRDFVLHVFKIPIPYGPNWSVQKGVLLECANKSCDKYEQQATLFFEKFANKRQIDLPLLAPQVNIQFDNFEQMTLIIRVCVPVERKGYIEQEIINNYLCKVHPLK